MKYMLLIYGDETAIGEAERQACYEESTMLAHHLVSEGKFLGASPLHSVSTATCLRVRDSRPLITDGPFTEAREQLGGYFLIEANHLDEALAIAARIPAAKWGTVEVRPVLEVPNLPMFQREEAELVTAGPAGTTREPQ